MNEKKKSSAHQNPDIPRTPPQDTPTPAESADKASDSPLTEPSHASVQETPVMSGEAHKELRNGLLSYIRQLFHIRDDMMSPGEIESMMQENTVIHGSNMWILIMAILIASIGLYANSTAVIIGAMLISPLMNGILTMGYSLAVKDLDMLRHAFKRFGTQVIISLIASTLFFLVAPLDEPTAEMIARTSPTFWDVLIALFGGVAGIIGNTRQKKSNVIPGVAIATALMPPLCTVGYGIATLQPTFIFGALYLFLINTMLIGLSACLVCNILKIPNHVEMDMLRQKKINRIVATVTVLVIIPSILTGAYTIYTAHVESNIERYIETEFTFPNTQVVQSEVDREKKVISVALVGSTISQETVDVLRGQLKQYDLDQYTLQVTQNALTDIDKNSDVITIAIQENTINELQKKIEEQNARLEELENTLSASIDFNALAAKAEGVFPYLSKCRCGVMSDQGKEYILLTAFADRELTDNEMAVLQRWLREESGSQNVSVWFYD